MAHRLWAIAFHGIIVYCSIIYRTLHETLLRGICYFYLTIKCAKADLHSGLFGGAVPEAMTDLFQIMSKLVDRDRKILVPGKSN